jgi:hypothetical protein
MPDTPPQSSPPEPEAASAGSQGPGPDRAHQQRPRPSGTLVLSAIAIIVSVVTFLFAYRAQNRQNTDLGLQTDRGLLLQLRSEYPQITSLVEHPPASGIELETTLSVTASLLHSLNKEASGADFLFIGDAYRMDHYPELAIPLYKEALERLSQSADKITALRGLGYAEALIEEPRAANAAMSRAVAVNAHSGYPRIAKYNTEASTQRVWVAVTATVHECAAAREHLRQYFALHKQHLPEPNWGTAPGETQQVETIASTCR